VRLRDASTGELKRQPHGRMVNAMPLNSSQPFDPLRFVEPCTPPKSREARIAEIAYFKAQRRGFEPGHEQADWLAAEAEVDGRYDVGGRRKVGGS
jgi:hypothetical protein